MKYEFTQELLDTISPYVDMEKVVVNENTLTSVISSDKTNEEEVSDTITICHNFLIEIFDNSVNVFYIDDHRHFYSEIDDDWKEATKEFIVDILTTPIFIVEKYRGSQIISSTYYLLTKNGKEMISHFSHAVFKKLFAKKSKQHKYMYWNKKDNCFDCRPPYEPSENVYKAIQVSDNCAIEITQKGNGFTYNIIKLDYDEYDDSNHHYWVPMSHPLSIYDTIEKAEENAREYLKTIE